MCGRYAITLPPEAVRQWFHTQGGLPNWPVNYNAAPTQILPVVRQTTDGRELALMEWGLIPFFSNDGKAGYSTINARAETVREKPTFRGSFKTRRCIVAASGYFEWSGPKAPNSQERHRGRARSLARHRDPSRRTSERRVVRRDRTGPKRNPWGFIVENDAGVHNS